ncbi:MAG: bifunctional UDP-N-acetylglucosamine diphosphorylase/glucosamine-1-phosphate N-acetyltransferase GlmU [Gammaproteobacteria bacterium]|nr:bifunctional UDP-N-acetylglucosamine diphosphorylase/glucosamine-1-phosphate N-acetyltransferase GlmU [Gammaproteobacteria bacterium]
MNLEVLILAAGKGKRMRSARPKVLHALGGRSLLCHVYTAARRLEPDSVVVVYGHGGDAVKQQLPDIDAHWVLQAQQRGTGHAVQLGLTALASLEPSVVLVLYGDVPLINPDTLQPLIEQGATGALALLSVRLENPTGYGRIVRDHEGIVQRIVEEADASASERAIDEVSTGIIAVPGSVLSELIEKLDCDNAQGEYYLTDIVAHAVQRGVPVAATLAENQDEVLGVNSRAQLAHMERIYQRRVAQALMDGGATLADPARLDVRGELRTGVDVFIDVGCVFEGTVTLGDRTQVGPYCVIRDSEMAADAQILAHTVIDGATLGERVSVGPFARLRPGSRLAPSSKVGNFVEMKNAELGERSKVNHLSYVGDAQLGRDVNIGAGTITCNYDGAYKHRTQIGDGVFVGSNTALVAPVTLGDGATVGAGSTINKDVPAGDLAVARAQQKAVRDWQRPSKKKT